MTADLIRAIGALTLSATAKFVGTAMLTSGINKVAELAALVGLPKSTVYRAQAEFIAAGGAELLTGLTIPTVPTSENLTVLTDEKQTEKSVSLVSPVRISEPVASCAGATMELPTVINNSLKREGELALDRDVPHMNGKGFIISAKHDVYIPTMTIAKWRAKYTSLPDLEATISGLSAHILSKGHMHAGWQCPEGWMVKLIAEENTKAENVAREAKAREGRASGSKPSDKAAAAQNFQQLLERSMAGSA